VSLNPQKLLEKSQRKPPADAAFSKWINFNPIVVSGLFV
jgi:hypothetical protein